MPDELVALLQATAYNLYLCTLVGRPAPMVAAAYARISAPQIGDWVMEVSTIYRPERNGERFGRLLRIMQEPVYSAEEWAQNGGGDDPIPTQDVWYLALPDGREYGWFNASFIAVPDGIKSWPANPDPAHRTPSEPSRGG